MLIDSHGHLDDEFFNGIRDEIIKKFSDDNIKYFVEASCSKETILNSISLADSNEKIYAILGVHPDNADELNEEVLQLIKNNLKNNKVIGVGEIGLDYYESNVDKNLQKQAFIKQAVVAHEAHLPVCIHLRDAYGDFFEIVKNNLSLFQDGFLVHCYSGSIEFANQMLNLVPNCYFAFGGVSTFKNARGIIDVIRLLPIDRILSETDCPYLTPEPLRGKEKNQPKYVDYIVQKLADIKHISKNRMEQQIEENFKTLFKKIK